MPISIYKIKWFWVYQLPRGIHLSMKLIEITYIINNVNSLEIVAPSNAFEFGFVCNKNINMVTVKRYSGIKLTLNREKKGRFNEAKNSKVVHFKST